MADGTGDCKCWKWEKAILETGLSSHNHTREALTTKVYGKDFDCKSDELLDLHDRSG